jgi:hypothetical protein
MASLQKCRAAESGGYRFHTIGKVTLQQNHISFCNFMSAALRHPAFA